MFISVKRMEINTVVFTEIFTTNTMKYEKFGYF